MINVTDSIMNQYGTKTAPVDKNSKSGNELNMDSFLQLLVTQMKYQDPLEPTKNEDFLAQLAQYSSLEQMQNMNKSSQMSQANQMIGKVVQANVTNPITNEIDFVEGFVDSVAYREGKIYLVVGEKEVTLEDVLNVTYVDYETKSAMTMDDISETLTKINEKLEALTKKDEQTSDTTDETPTDGSVSDES